MRSASQRESGAVQIAKFGATKSFHIKLINTEKQPRNPFPKKLQIVPKITMLQKIKGSPNISNSSFIQDDVPPAKNQDKVCNG